MRGRWYYDVAGDLKDDLRAAFETYLALSQTDAAGGIGDAADEAQRLADWMGISLASALKLAALGPQGVPVANPDPSGKVYGGRGGDPRQAGGRAIDWQQRDATAFLASREPPRPVAGGVGGGGGARVDPDSFAAISAQADKALADLDLAIAAIDEKVKAGLLSAAEGQGAVRQAVSGSADAIAGLIPKLESAAAKAGPEGAAKVAELRAALKGLAGDLKGTAAEISKTFADSLGQGLGDFVTGAKTAGEAFTGFANTVLEQIARIVAKRFTSRFITPLIDGLLSFLPFAAGGVPAAPALAAWSNRVVERPIAFAMKGGIGVAGEAGAEAILPLRQGQGGPGVLATDADGQEGVLGLARTRSGALGVVLPVPAGPVRGAFAEGGVPGLADILARPTFFAGPGVLARMTGRQQGEAAPVPARRGGAAARVPADTPVKVVVNVTNTAPGVAARQSERQEGGTRIVDVLVEQVEASIAANARRGVGPLSDVLGGVYGMGRVAR